MSGRLRQFLFPSQQFGTHQLSPNPMSTLGQPQPHRRSLDSAGGLVLVLHWLSSTMAAYTLQQIFAITAAVCTRDVEIKTVQLINWEFFSVSLMVTLWFHCWNDWITVSNFWPWITNTPFYRSLLLQPGKRLWIVLPWVTPEVWTWRLILPSSILRR